eukprot:scaffold417_cov101-Isochrysis_galbana.AAC.1
MGYLHRRRLRRRRRDIEFGWVHRGQRDVRRMDRHHDGLVGRSLLRVIPAIEGTKQRGIRTLAFYGGVTVLELSRSLCNRAGREYGWIGKLGVKAKGATMYDGCGSGKAIHIYGPKIIGAHSEAAHMLVVVLGPSVTAKAMVPILKNRERARVEVGPAGTASIILHLNIAVNITSPSQQRSNEARGLADGSSKLTKAEKRRLNTRYSRGEGNTSKGVTKPVLKRSIKRQEAKISAAERQAAQAEVLQPTEAGYLEAEGPLERTARVRQSQLAGMVDVQTAQKAYDVQLDQLGPYRVAFTPNGRRVLLGGRKGHVAVAQWEGGFRVLSEIQASRHLSSILRLLFCPAHPRPFSITTNGRASRCRPPPPPVARLVGSLSAISSCAARRAAFPSRYRSFLRPRPRPVIPSSPRSLKPPSGISTPPSGISGAGDGAGRLLPARPHQLRRGPAQEPVHLRPEWNRASLPPHASAAGHICRNRADAPNKGRSGFRNWAKEVNRLAFLRYHWLLATVGPQGALRYLDVSTGENVAEHRTRLGDCDCMRANPWNAVLHLGHSNGAVTLWTPNLAEPVAKLLCHKGAVADVAIDRGGRYMATAGKDGTLKVWDVRTFRPLHSYTTPRPVSSMDVSDRGLLAAACGAAVHIYKDGMAARAGGEGGVTEGCAKRFLLGAWRG